MKLNPTPPHLTHATGTPVSDNLNIQTGVLTCDRPRSIRWRRSFGALKER
jgi:hypothetical protein